MQRKALCARNELRQRLITVIKKSPYSMPTTGSREFESDLSRNEMKKDFTALFKHDANVSRRLSLADDSSLEYSVPENGKQDNCGS